VRIRRDHEQADLLELRCAGCGELDDAGVIPVVEADAFESLDELDAVEDAAAHETRSLEGVAPRAHHDDRLLSRLQALHHLAVGGLAEQAASDGRDRRRRGIEIDESVSGGPFSVGPPLRRPNDHRRR
jgi:hypothetical protein